MFDIAGNYVVGSCGIGTFIKAVVGIVIGNRKALFGDNEGGLTFNQGEQP